MKNKQLLLFLFPLAISSISCTTTQVSITTEEAELIDNHTEETTSNDMDNQEEETETEVISIIYPEDNANSNGNMTSNFNCSGSSEVTLFQLANKKREIKNFTTNVNKNNTLNVNLKDDAQGVNILLSLTGVESIQIKPGKYPSKNTDSQKYATVSLTSTSLGNHNFGDNFKGYIEIIDYGFSSNIICGSYDLTDIKGNRLVGNFNETITTF